MDTLDIILLVILFLLSLYWYREKLFGNYSNEVVYSKLPAQKSSEKYENSDEFAAGGFMEKVKKQEYNTLTFYGSQTGTAEDFTYRIVKEGTQYGMKCMAADLMDFDMEDLKYVPKNVLVIFLLATYGDGEPTDNARDFAEWIHSEDLDFENEQMQNAEGRGLLSNCNYLIFGLGNRTYEQFNAFARKVDRRLEQLGANKLYERGEGDDNANIEEDFVDWSAKMWKVACKFHDIDPSKVDFGLVRSFNFTKNLRSNAKIYHGEIGVVGSWSGQQNRLSYDQKNPYYAPIKAWRELCSKDGKALGDPYPQDSSTLSETNTGASHLAPVDDSRRCLHIELDISGAGNMRYQAGDHVAIYPKNDEAEVKMLANALGLTTDEQLDTAFSMKAFDVTSSKKSPFPCPTTFRAALTHYVDITSAPKLNLLSILAQFAQDESEKKHLKQLCESKTLYMDYIKDSGRTLRQVLSDHPSVSILLDKEEVDNTDTENSRENSPFRRGQKLTIADILELLPRLQPRYYSIASSPKANPTSIHITASLVNYQTKTGEWRKGVTTGWLYDLCWHSYAERNLDVVDGIADNSKMKLRERVPIFIRQSTFKLPRNPLTPVVMIGPGTGVAPFRSFIQERNEVARTKLKNILEKKQANISPEDSSKIEESLSKTSLELDQPGKLMIAQHRLPGMLNEEFDNINGQSAQPSLASLKNSINLDKIVGKSILFFGCRYRTQDFLYKDELLDAQFKLGSTPKWKNNDNETMPLLETNYGLSELMCAFSRDTSKKVYVQHMLREYSHQLRELILVHGAYIYVCGDAKNMSRDVHECLVEILAPSSQQGENVSREASGEAQVQKLKQQSRYLEDVWS